MLQVTIKGDLQGVVEELEGYASIADSGVEIGVMDVSHEEAVASETLEHRWHAEGPEIPDNWTGGEEYVTWAYAARTAKTIEETLLPEIQNLIDKGVDGEEFWHKVGRMGVATMKGVIRNVDVPHNADSTIRKKGFDNPLIETGGMLDSVDYKLKDREDMGKVESVSDVVPPAF